MSTTAGLRISETLTLMPKDVDRSGGTPNVLDGKGSKQRMVALDLPAFRTVERWLDPRKQLQLSAPAPLLCTLRAKPVQSAYVRAPRPRLAAEAGVEKRVHARGLKHIFASELMREGPP